MKMTMMMTVMSWTWNRTSLSVFSNTTSTVCFLDGHNCQWRSVLTDLVLYFSFFCVVFHFLLLCKGHTSFFSSFFLREHVFKFAKSSRGWNVEFPTISLYTVYCICKMLTNVVVLLHGRYVTGPRTRSWRWRWTSWAATEPTCWERCSSWTASLTQTYSGQSPSVTLCSLYIYIFFKVLIIALIELHMKSFPGILTFCVVH